jgi:hypothetical protein
MKRTILLTLLLACGTADASDWVFVGKSDDGKTRTYIDISSVRVTDNIRRACFKAVHAPHSAKEKGGPDANKWWSESVSRRAFDCSAETFSDEALTVYYEDGTNGSESPSAYPSPWEPVPPDTALSGEMQFICAWKPK